MNDARLSMNVVAALPWRVLGCILLATVIFSPISALAQGGEQKTSVDGLPYLVTLPDTYNADQTYPLLLFLHGGDRSNTKHHPQKYAKGEGLAFPFIVVAPHCRGGCSWPRVDIDALLQEVLSAYAVDESRIYLTGYSMGGHGVWSVLSRSPQWFAAAAPIAGGGDPRSICSAKDVAIRAYHGDHDNVIPHTRSEQMIDALNACDGNAELIIYPGGNHGSWIPTFKDPSFYAWLLSHHRE